MKTEHEYFKQLSRGIILKEDLLDEKDTLWQQIDAKCPVSPPKTRKNLIFYYLSVILIFGLLIWGSSTLRHYSSNRHSLTVVLPDSSTVVLAAGSQLQYNVLGWRLHRGLVLTGRASFEVRHGSYFTVQTAQGRVTVVGTKFNVSDRADQLQVECIEGSVNVITPKTAQMLLNGQRLVCDNKHHQRAKIQPIQSELTFEQTPLDTVCHVLSETFHVKVTCSDDLARRPFSGRISTLSLHYALDRIGTSCNVRCTASKSGFAIH